MTKNEPAKGSAKSDEQGSRRSDEQACRDRLQDMLDAVLRDMDKIAAVEPSKEGKMEMGLAANLTEFLGSVLIEMACRAKGT